MIRPAESITNQVKALYEAFPYPHYPLFAPLRWQDGYLSSVSFARRLLVEQTRLFKRSNKIVESYEHPRILLAGSGEALPYIMGKLEPPCNQVDSLDISSRSMRRARTRMLWTTRKKSFHAGDLNTYLAAPAMHEAFDHIDSFGVVHHLPNPAQSLRLFASALKPGGTARIMVYNSPARTWITHLQRAFRLLHLDLHQSEDRQLLLQLLATLRKDSEQLDEKLRGMGSGTLNSATRLVDTFMHTHEIRWDIKRWINEFNAVGLQPYALFDRYGELDDLPNPLWQMPSSEDLQIRAEDGRFEGNLEVFLHKPAPAPEVRAFLGTTRDIWRHYLRGAPSWWNTYEETDKLSVYARQQLWWNILGAIYHEHPRSKPVPVRDLLAQHRLARIGAILPSQCDAQLAKRLSKAITSSSVTVSMYENHLPARSPASITLIDKILGIKNIASARRRDAILSRLNIWASGGGQ